MTQTARTRPSAPAFLAALGLALWTTAGATPAAAQGDEVIRATMMGAWQTDRGSHMTGVKFALAPDWKTYWRAPGDAGIPPAFDWTGSENLAGVRFHWPSPMVFDFNGMRTIGYRDELVLPFEVIARNPAQPVRLRVSANLGVCREICVPATVTFAADLHGAGAPDSALRAALRDRPDSGREAGVSGLSCEVAPLADGLRVTARLRMPPLGPNEVVVLEPGGGAAVWVSEAQVTRSGKDLTATVDMVPDGPGFALDRSGMTVTVLAAGRAVEMHGCPAP